MVGGKSVCLWASSTHWPLEEQVLLQFKPFLEDCMLKARRSISRDTEGGTCVWKQNKTAPHPHPMKKIKPYPFKTREAQAGSSLSRAPM